VEQQKLSSKVKGRRKSVGASHDNTTIAWIEKLLQTPVDDCRQLSQICDMEDIGAIPH